MRQPSVCTLAAAAAIIAMVMTSGVVAGQMTPEQRRAEAEGRRLLDEGDFPGAAQIFAAQAAGVDGVVRSRFNFLWALTEHRQGLADADPALMESAARRYRAVLTDTESAAAHNNLAKVLEALNRPGAARRQYEAAIRINDERRWSYQENYGSFLASQGEFDAAVGAYREVALANPQYSRANDWLVRRFVGTRDPELLTYAWQLYGRAQQARAGEVALQGLAGGVLTSDGERIQLLALFVATIGDRFPDRASFTSSGDHELLLGLANDTRIGQGIGELIALLTPSAELEAPWWSEQDDWYEPDQLRQIGPSLAFREYARVLGSWRERAGGVTDAASYYRFSARTPDGQIDAEGVRRLVRLYATGGTREDVYTIANEFTPELFESKSAAYGQRDLRTALQLHLTLGELFGAVELWGDEGTPASAVFQLSRAMSAADALVDLDHTGDRYEVRPAHVDLLARGYAETDRETDAFEIRVQAAERYDRTNDAPATQSVLEPIDRDNIPEDVEQRYRDFYVATVRNGPVGPIAPGVEPTLLLPGQGTFPIGTGNRYRLNLGEPGGELTDEETISLGVWLSRAVEAQMQGEVPNWDADFKGIIQGVVFDGDTGEISVRHGIHTLRIPFQLNDASGEPLGAFRLMPRIPS